MDPRGIKGSWESVVFYVNAEKTEAIQALGRRGAMVRGPHAVGPEVPQAGRHRGSRPTRSTWSSRRATAGRSRRSASTCRTTRTSASGTAASRCRCPTSSRRTTSRRPPASAPSSRGTRGGRAGGEVEHAVRRAADEHARGDRPRLGRQADGFKGSPRRRIKEHYSALEEGRADLVALYFMADPKLAELGLIAAARAGGDRPRRVRGLHAQRADAAPARPRGGRSSKRTTCATARWSCAG